MTIYEIDEQLLALTDPETGEILDFEAFDSLQMAREDKIEGVALWIKDLDAEAKAIREEEKTLASRRQADERKIESLKNYLSYALHGEKFKTPKAQISYRKSTSVDIPDETLFMQGDGNSKYLKAKWSIDKTLVKDDLKAGIEIPGASLKESQNLQIK